MALCNPQSLLQMCEYFIQRRTARSASRYHCVIPAEDATLGLGQIGRWMAHLWPAQPPLNLAILARRLFVEGDEEGCRSKNHGVEGFRSENFKVGGGRRKVKKRNNIC